MLYLRVIKLEVSFHFLSDEFFGLISPTGEIGGKALIDSFWFLQELQHFLKVFSDRRLK